MLGGSRGNLLGSVCARGGERQKELEVERTSVKQKEQVRQMQGKGTCSSGTEGKISRRKPGPGVETMDLSRRNSC